MKRQLTAVFLIFALVLTMTGCSAANAAQKLDAAEDRIEAKLDAAEDKLEDSLRKAAAPTPAATESARELTGEQALEIALNHLGLTADQVTGLCIEYEVDDGIAQFDIEFHQGDWEHEFEIHAENGKILSYDKDSRYD